jgi:hypothetical protein
MMTLEPALKVAVSYGRQLRDRLIAAYALRVVA